MKKRHAQADSIITTSLEDNINQILSKLDQMPDLTVQRFSWNQGEEAAILYIEEPYLEPTIKGAHDGFVENASKNLGLLRRYIPSPELKLRQLKIGERGKVTITMAYLEDVANPKVIEELERRIQALSLDVIINIGELQQLISKNTFTVFPQFLVTERPDTTAMQILKGRVAILMDRSPGVLIAPMDLVGFLETKDDYNVNWLLASFVRLLRYIAFMISLVLPAFYVATISFHFEVIPLKLLLSIGESREKVSFPPVLEALVMELSLEMLREAGLRLPGPIGQTVSIVGGIVIGQAAVQAGIVSNIMVIVVSITAIASFIIPYYDMSSTLSHDDACLFLWLCRNYHGFNDHVYPPYYLTSIGTPYGSPFAPVRMKEWKDAVILTAPRYLTARPHSASPLQEKKKKATDPTDR
ncbi:spore germination protein [Brevibacillus halotolerans]|uniref:Spore germination protein n=2 Tax=Brevibacillus TaxID=55080 RepID=A0ABT4HV09_9BACL|nr:spore germination protein [Brevibacillus halotolerans]